MSVGEGIFYTVLLLVGAGVLVGVAATADSSPDDDAVSSPPTTLSAQEERCATAHRWAEESPAADLAVTAFYNTAPGPDRYLLGLRSANLRPLSPGDCLRLDAGQPGWWAAELYISAYGTNRGSGLHLVVCQGGGDIGWAIPNRMPLPETMEWCRARAAAGG